MPMTTYTHQLIVVVVVHDDVEDDAANDDTVDDAVVDHYFANTVGSYSLVGKKDAAHRESHSPSGMRMLMRMNIGRPSNDRSTNDHSATTC